MAEHRDLDELFVDIAGQIRAKKGTSNPIKADDLPYEVSRIISEGGVDTSDATATIDDLLFGKTAYLADGGIHTGTQHEKATSDIDFEHTSEGGLNLKVPHGLYKTDATVAVPQAVIHKPAINTIKGNKKVTATASVIMTNGYQPGGTIEGYSVDIDANDLVSGTKDVTPTASGFVEDVASYKYVDVAGDTNLVPEHVKKDVTIFGVQGTYEGSGGVDPSDATATAADILYPKTAYIATGKVTGTQVEKTASDIELQYNGNNLDLYVPKGVYKYETYKAVPSAGFNSPNARFTYSDNSVTIIPFCSITSSGYTSVCEKTRPWSAKYTISASNLTSGTYDIIPQKETSIYSITNYSYVSVAGDNNLIPGNIAKDVSIFGVVGVLESGGIHTSDATATAADILAPKTAYISDGTKAIGTIESLSAFTHTPTTSDINIPSGKYLAGTQTIKGDVNLIPKNIAKGVSIFGVSGTHEAFEPSGTLFISANGIHDVYNYSNVNVNISGGGGTSAFINWTETRDAQAFYEIQNSVSCFASYFAYKNESISYIFGNNCRQVDQYAFTGCTNLESVQLNNCSYISSYAFQNDFNLSSISFSNCQYIGESAFQACSSIVETNFPNCSVINNFAFHNCTNLSNATFNNCIEIKTGVFLNCKQLTNISFPVCRGIGAKAFSNCVSLMAGLFPECSYIDELAFTRCTQLASIYIPNCSYIGFSAFLFCSMLTHISIPKIEQINGAAFSGTGISNLHILSATLLTQDAFENMSSLQSIRIDRYINTYSAYLFGSCISLQNVELGVFTAAASTMFYKCSSLSTIKITGYSIGTINSTIFGSAKNLTSIYTWADNVDTLKATAGWSFYSDRIQGMDIASQQGIYYKQYLNNQSISTISNTVQFVSYAGCSGCTALTEIDLPNCSFIDSWGFSGCTNITQVSLPICTYLDTAAFNNNQKLSNIYIPNCSTIAGATFYRCNSLQNIDLPNCTSIGDRAFSMCSNLSNLNLPICSYVGSGAFGQCSSLQNITLQNCTYLGSQVFEQCINLVNVNLSNCSYIENAAFKSCTKLESLNLQNCSYIGVSVFSGCEKINNIIFNSSYFSLDCGCLIDTYRGSIIKALNLSAASNIIFDYSKIDYYALASNKNIQLVSLPNITSITLTKCTNLSSINIPGLSILLGGTVSGCYKVSMISFPNCSIISDDAFRYTSIKTAYFMSASIVSLSSRALIYSPIQSYYVPSSLADAYKVASYWSSAASKIIGI